MMNYKIFGAFLIVVAVTIFLAVGYKNSQRAHQTIVYSPTYMLNALWQSYQKNYIDAQTGRTMDKQRDDITTSEGESYTMLRAVWADDKTVFDRSWQWTQQNLQRPDTNLFYWLYGKKSDGSFGILTDQGGQNSATDADTDIALALVLASRRWQDPNYLEQSKKIISAIWQNEVVVVKGVPYVAADDIEKNATSQIAINPSYFSPYAYRIFETIDTQDPWQLVVTSSYSLLNQSISEPLDTNASAKLPPDWLLLDINSGALLAPSGTTTTSNFGYDALRVPFRIAVDFQWNNDPQAKNFLEKLSFLSTQWQITHQLTVPYSHDGKNLSAVEAPAMYGGTLGYFMVTDPQQAKDVYTTKLQNLYNPDSQDWSHAMSYYDDNWAWFGMALYNNRILNFGG